MSTVKLILVTSSNPLREVLPWEGSPQTVDLDVDPDNALEHIRAYFQKTWEAEMHALRWIYPEDLLLPFEDPTPVLVLHVNNRGKLSPASPIRASAAPCASKGDVYIKHLLLAASRTLESEPWSHPDWYHSMSRWIKCAFGCHQVQQVSQVRVCTNGAVLKIEMAGGIHFLKTLPVSSSHEIQLLTLLDEHLPGICPSLIPLRPDGSSHITREVHGRPMRLVNDPAEWKAAFGKIAQLQLGSVPLVDRLRTIGLPYQTFSDFVTNLKEAVANLVRLQKGAPNELAARELDAIPNLIKRAACAGEILGQCSIPEALVHGDLNESNIFLGPAGAVTLIDWTFSRIGHPFFALGFSLFAARQLGHRMHACWRELLDAYADPWCIFAEKGRLMAGMDAAARLFWIDAAQEIGRFVVRTRLDLPGTVAHLPVVLRCALSSFGLVD